MEGNSMESIRKLESVVAQWYEKAPHLPVNGQIWLAKNIWWIGLVGVALGIFGVFGVLAVTFWASTAIGVYGGVIGAVAGSLAFIAVLVALAFSILLLVLLAIAVMPLKEGKKKGWDLLFICGLLNFASTIIGFLLSLNIGSLLAGLMSVAITGYFLFEIRSYFKSDGSDSKLEL